MKTAVFSYSFTGNNDALAEHIAKGLRAEHIRITEPKKRTYGTIAADIIFGRTPKTAPGTETLPLYDFIIFVCPVWMGQPAFPLRSYLRYIKEHPQKYAYISISGGGINPNPGLKDSIIKRAGAEPCVFIDMHIADFLPAEPKPTAKETGAYKLTKENIDEMSGRVLSELKEEIGRLENS